MRLGKAAQASDASQGAGECDAMNVAGDEQETYDRHGGVGADEHERTGERARAVDDVADDDGSSDAGDIAEGVEQPA